MRIGCHFLAKQEKDIYFCSLSSFCLHFFVVVYFILKKFLLQLFLFLSPSFKWWFADKISRCFCKKKKHKSVEWEDILRNTGKSFFALLLLCSKFSSSLDDSCYIFWWMFFRFSGFEIKKLINQKVIVSAFKIIIGF